MSNLLEIYNNLKKQLTSNGVVLDEILILEELIDLNEWKEFKLTKKQMEKMSHLAWSGYLKFDGYVHHSLVASAIVNYWLYESKENDLSFEDFEEQFDRWVFCEYLVEVL